MDKCPQCGSSDVIPDLIVFAPGTQMGDQPVHLSLVEPEPANRPFVWKPQSVTTGFRATVCGNCGHTALYTRHHAELLAAHKKGYKGKAARGN